MKEGFLEERDYLRGASCSCGIEQGSKSADARMIWTVAEAGSFVWLQPRSCLERTQATRLHSLHSLLRGYLPAHIFIYLSESEELISVMLSKNYVSQDRLWALSSSHRDTSYGLSFLSKKKGRGGLISACTSQLFRGRNKRLHRQIAGSPGFPLTIMTQPDQETKV